MLYIGEIFWSLQDRDQSISYCHYVKHNRVLCIIAINCDSDERWLFFEHIRKYRHFVYFILLIDFLRGIHKELGPKAHPNMPNFLKDQDCYEKVYLHVPIHTLWILQSTRDHLKYLVYCNNVNVK